jgi:VWFA-related protein
VTVALLLPVMMALARSGPAQQPTQPPIRSGVELVVVDVQVVDRQGRPLGSLRPEDFEVSLDGKRRRVVSAELVRHEGVVQPGGLAGQPAPSAAPTGADTQGRRFILAIDEHSFRPAAARAAMQAAGRFIDRLQPNDLVGLYTYPTGAVHSDLTNDHASVKQLVEKVTGLLDLPLNRFDLSKSEVIDIASGDLDTLNRVALRTCVQGDSTCRRSIQNDAVSLAGYFEMQVTQSLGGLRHLVRGLAQLQGRKTLVIVSGGLFTSDRGGGRVNMGSEIQYVGREAASANANLYVLHMDSSFIDAFSTQRGPSQTLFRDSNALASGLEMIAGAAGGASIRVQAGTGDSAFDRVLLENSAYYLLGVEPDAADRDGEPHRIQVRVRVRGATVRSRATVTVPRLQG